MQEKGGSSYAFVSTVAYISESDTGGTSHITK